MNRAMPNTHHPTPNPEHLERGAVIVAAGRGTRMGADKIWLPLGPMPVIAYSLRAFSRHAGRTVLVVSAERVREARRLALELGLEVTICQGGERRQDSVLNGLHALGEVSLVAVHDGARPLVSDRLIEECYLAACRYGAAVAAVPIRDTIKRERTDGSLVEETISREGLWAAQTPQAFQAPLLLRAYQEVAGDVTDDASVLELAGYPVRIVPGDAFNFKLTTREDLEVARALVRRPAFRDQEFSDVRR